MVTQTNIQANVISPSKRVLIPFLFIIPFLAAAVFINVVQISPRELIYDGSYLIFWRNISLLCTAPYLITTFIGLAELIGFPLRREIGVSDAMEDAVISIFVGASLLSILGMALGLLSLLSFPLLISVFGISSYIFFYRNPDIINGLLKWFLVREELFVVAGYRRALLATIRILPIFLLFNFMVLVKWKTNNDVYQFYLPYFEQAKLHHSSLIDPAIRDVFGFLLARGRGVLLVFTSLTWADGLAVVGYLYAFLIALMVRQMAKLLSSNLAAPSSSYLQRLIVDSIMVLAFWTVTTSARAGGVSIGRTHLETGAFLTFFFWITLQATCWDPSIRGRKIFRSLLLPATAFPLMIATGMLAIGLTLSLAFLFYFIIRDSVAAKNVVKVVLIALVATAVSLLLNQFYIGIAEVNPYALFLPLADVTSLRHWTSPEYIFYLNDTQNIEYFPSLNLNSLAAMVVRLKEYIWDLVVPIPVIPSIFQFVFAAVLVYFLKLFDGFFKSMPGKIQLIWRQLLMYLGVIALLIVVSTYGSLVRLFGFQVAFGPLLFILPALLMLSNPSLSVFQFLSPAYRRIPFWIFLLSSFITVFNNFKVAISDYEPSENIFIGKIGLAGFPSQWWGEFHCEKYLTLVPADKVIVPVNGGNTLSSFCSGSPFLERTKMIETLHPPYASEFGTIMLGTPEQAIAILKRYNADYFVVELHNYMFWAVGSSDLFTPANLIKYFDVSYEDPTILLLTWRGQGKRAATLEDSNRIEELRTTPGAFNMSAERLRKWVSQRRN